MLASLCLVVSAALALTSGPEAESSMVVRLRARGWQETDSLACPGVAGGAYVEVENDDASAEALVLPSGRALAAHLPLPEGPYRCHEISEPHFIEEVP